MTTATLPTADTGWPTGKPDKPKPPKPKPPKPKPPLRSRRKRPDLCAQHGHPGCTYNVAMHRTWCLCGEVVTEGDTSVPHVACCGGPLEEAS